MANIFSYASITHHPTAQHQHQHLGFQPNRHCSVYKFCRSGEKLNPTSDFSPADDRESKPENALLKVAWYSSELLGVATSFFRPPPKVEAALELARDGSGAVDRARVVKSVKDDFERSYFVTAGNLTLGAYDEDSEFADPASSIKGLQRFKSNCTYEVGGF